MARAAACEVAKLVRLCGEDGFASGRTEIDRALTAFHAARPAMAAPVNMMHDLRAAFGRCATPGSFLETIDRLMKQSEQAEAAVAQQAAERIRDGERLMTISYSGTVLRMLSTAKSRVAHVYVCEGRPVLEGRRMARAIAREGIPVTLLTDAQAFALMPRVDRAVIGADTILSNHDAVNKVGSAHLAFAARHFDKPFTVVAATHKFVRAGAAAAVPVEDNPPAEVWAGAPEGVAVCNTYYEAVPHGLITQIITEHGPQSAG
jgi:translation initiation factor 2B subunit (eIF-2B alpha/beta/delta family)